VTTETRAWPDQRCS